MKNCYTITTFPVHVCLSSCHRWVYVITITGKGLRSFSIEAWAPNGRTLCAFVETAFGLGETRRITCGLGTVGGRIGIVLRSNEPLQLCEVQVFGARGKLLFINILPFAQIKLYNDE